MQILSFMKFFKYQIFQSIWGLKVLQYERVIVIRYIPLIIDCINSLKLNYEFVMNFMNKNNRLYCFCGYVLYGVESDQQCYLNESKCRML